MRVHHGKEAWQQVAGMVTETEAKVSHLKPAPNDILPLAREYPLNLPKRFSKLGTKNSNGQDYEGHLSLRPPWEVIKLGEQISHQWPSCPFEETTHHLRTQGKHPTPVNQEINFHCVIP